MKLKEALSVMKRYCKQEMGDMTHTLLMGAIENSPVKVIHGELTMKFAEPCMPFTKQVRVDDSVTQWVSMEWEDISNKRTSRCVAFAKTALAISRDFASECAQNEYKTAKVMRIEHGTTNEVNLYNELRSCDYDTMWKGYRVLPVDWATRLFDDQETEPLPEDDDASVCGDINYQREVMLRKWQNNSTGVPMQCDNSEDKENQNSQYDEFTPLSRQNSSTTTTLSQVEEGGSPLSQLSSFSNISNSLSVASPHLLLDDEANEQGSCQMCQGYCNPASQVCGRCARNGTRRGH